MNMRKQHSYIIWIVLVCVILALIAVVWMLDRNTGGKDMPEIENNGDEQHIKTTEEIVDEELAKMSLDEKIGQMIFIAYREEAYDDTLNNILTDVKPSGFILFEQNISSYEDTIEYIKKIKSTAKTPMFISIDQEGGRVQRIKDVDGVEVQTIPSMLELGKRKDPSLSMNVGKVLGTELAAFGINMDFAPVLDIFSNENNTVIGDRAFGTDAETVTKLAIPFSLGMEEAGVIPVVKHFPGHGDTKEDSHVELPIVDKTLEELYERELVPFKKAIDEKAPMIMVAHIALPEITGDNTPASLSKKIVGDILRGEMKYDGVVITDAVEMKALADNYTEEEICKMSIDAGVDIILMPQDPILARDTIKKLVTDGTITEDRINESVKRILLLKHNYDLYDEKELKKENIGSEYNKKIIESIDDKESNI